MYTASSTPLPILQVGLTNKIHLFLSFGLSAFVIFLFSPSSTLRPTILSPSFLYAVAYTAGRSPTHPWFISLVLFLCFCLLFDSLPLANSALTCSLPASSTLLLILQVGHTKPHYHTHTNTFSPLTLLIIHLLIFSLSLIFAYWRIPRGGNY